MLGHQMTSSTILRIKVMTDGTLPKHRPEHITAVYNDTDGQKDRQHLETIVTTALLKGIERKELTFLCESKKYISRNWENDKCYNL